MPSPSHPLDSQHSSVIQLLSAIKASFWAPKKIKVEKNFNFFFYREDCYEMLTECIDWSRIPPGQTVTSLCGKLSPGDQTSPCVSLRPFLEPSDAGYAPPGHQVTAPCKGEPCDSQELCQVNRNCEPGRPCQTYQCMPGRGPYHNIYLFINIYQKSCQLHTV